MAKISLLSSFIRLNYKSRRFSTKVKINDDFIQIFNRININPFSGQNWNWYTNIWLNKKHVSVKFSCFICSVIFQYFHVIIGVPFERLCLNKGNELIQGLPNFKLEQVTRVLQKIWKDIIQKVKRKSLKKNSVALSKSMF